MCVVNWLLAKEVEFTLISRQKTIADNDACIKMKLAL